MNIQKESLKKQGVEYPNSEPPSLGNRFPLPRGQFIGWMIFFNVAYVAVLILALVQVLQQPSTGIYANRLFAAGMIIAQFIVYVYFILILPRRHAWPLPSPTITAYFVINTGLACLTWVFHETMWWLLWPYLGQMFGMLAFRIAFPISIVIFGIMVWMISDIRYGEWNADALQGQFFFWVFTAASGLYSYQALRTSQQRGILITELEETQRELEAERDKNAELAVLKERERLARDMHDGLGHTMATLSVQLEAVQRLYPVDPEKASAMLDDSKQSIRESMESLRRTLSGLRAPGLGDRQLVDALRSLCHEFRDNADPKLTYTIAEHANQLPRPVADALWRVAQESLNNIQNHAHAHNATLTLRMGGQRVILEVTDDGIGMDPNATIRPNRYGITGMTERMEGLGGTLDIESRPNKGTTIKVSVPLIG